MYIQISNNENIIIVQMIDRISENSSIKEDHDSFGGLYTVRASIGKSHFKTMLM